MKRRVWARTGVFFSRPSLPGGFQARAERRNLVVRQPHVLRQSLVVDEQRVECVRDLHGGIGRVKVHGGVCVEGGRGYKGGFRVRGLQ
jgi:hypothetical protein